MDADDMSKVIRHALAARDQFKIGKPLKMDLIPRSAWGVNLRHRLTQSQWRKLRESIFQAADRRCEICGG